MVESESGKEMSLALTKIIHLAELAIASVTVNGAPPPGAIEGITVATSE